MQKRENYFQYRSEYLKDAVNRNKLQYLKKYIKKHRPQRLLDVGSGRGIISLEIHNLVGEIQGIEYNKSNLMEAEMFKKETGIQNVFFQWGDAKDIPFPNNEFDMVICSQVLEHIENPHHAVKELSRVSRGIVLVDVPTPLWELWQFSYWTLNKLRNPSRALNRYREVKKGGNASLKRAFQPEHVNKWAPWKWKNLLESQEELKVTETTACYISPTKKLNLFKPVESVFGKSRPFKYMGMVFFIESRKIQN